MTSPSNVPPVQHVLPPQADPVVTPEVVKAATRIVRTKSFLSRQLKSTVPAFGAGVVTTLVVAARRAHKQDSDQDVDTVDTYTE